jgi:hypothetical protein
MTEPEEKKIQTFEEIQVPDEFYKIINDFIDDILRTFPEYNGIVSKWWNKNSENDVVKKETLFVFRHCLKTFPERFFDILYKNDEMFLLETDINTEFLPGIVFKHLWSSNISENTRDTIWKYLQLILFSVIGSVQSSSDLGDTAKLFEAINEDELKSKLQETLENIQNLFENKESGAGAGEIPNPFGGDGIKMENMPDVNEIHEHINSMMGGKLGKLAMELAEETANDLNLDMENTTDTKDAFQKMFKNPGKLMNMVQNIGNKIDTKIKSGEIKESELMQEGMELLNKMKSMPGMGDIQKMFSQMGMPGLGKGGKVNMGAMEAQLNRNMKAAKMKERFKAKVESKQNNVNNAMLGLNNTVLNNAEQRTGVSDEELINIFSTGEKVEKTPRGAKPTPTPSSTKSKQKKGKK